MKMKKPEKNEEEKKRSAEMKTSADEDKDAKRWGENQTCSSLEYIVNFYVLIQLYVITSVLGQAIQYLIETREFRRALKSLVSKVENIWSYSENVVLLADIPSRSTTFC